MMPINNKRSKDVSGFQPLADINVTPLVDVMLVLLIIFMVTAPMLAAGLNISLPQANKAQSVAPKKPIVVSIAKDGKILVGRDEIARQHVAEAVRGLLGGDDNQPVYVQADREAVYGNIVAVIDLLTGAGIRKVVMMVERATTAEPLTEHHH